MSTTSNKICSHLITPKFTPRHRNPMTELENTAGEVEVVGGAVPKPCGSALEVGAVMHIVVVVVAVGVNGRARGVRVTLAPFGPPIDRDGG